MTTEFYESRQRLIEVYRSHPRRLALKAASVEELTSWAVAAREKFLELIGLGRMTPAPANPRQTEAVDCGDYVREHWLIDTEPDVTMPLYLLRPRGLSGLAPAVICCHGHGAGKEAVAGVTDDPEVAQAAAMYNYPYGVEMARAGMLAVCPDARGFGQRREADARGSPTQSSCAYLHAVGLGMGLTVVGMHAFDLVRLVDHLQTRDDVRADRIGCVGFSGGGWQALAAGIADLRLTCLVVSGYIHPVAAPLLSGKHLCPCNTVPHLWEHFDLGDLAGLIAPRPLLVQTGDADPLSGPGGAAEVQGQVDIARQAYRLLGCQDRLGLDVFHGGHRWDGTAAVPWVRRWLAS